MIYVPFLLGGDFFLAIRTSVQALPDSVTDMVVFGDGMDVLALGS